MSKKLKDKVVIITGASSGIGRATALALAREGARVALGARQPAALQAAAAAIQALGREALAVPTDVCQPDQVEHLVTATRQRWGRVDIVIANAGVYVRGPIAQLTAAEFERSMAVNFYGGVHLVLASLPHLLHQKSGHIVLVTSLDGKKGLPPDAPYVAAKFALTGFGEVLRQETHGTGVQVTTILPGRVDTPMIKTLTVPLISAKIAPEQVARAIVGALHRPRAEVILPPQTLPLVYLNTLAPALGDWAVRFFKLSGWES